MTDLFVYDWWALILGFAGGDDAAKEKNAKFGPHIKWIGELMEEKKIKALPRSLEALGRCYDTREFWTMFGLMPIRARV